MKDAIILLIPLAGMLLLTYLLLQHFFNKQLKENDKELINHKAKTYLPLKIQAYERAILFLERIDPNNLIIRIHKPSMNAAKLHLEILKQIREEYNHNMSQQIYISPKSWAELIKGKEAERIIADGKIKDGWTANHSPKWRYYMVTYKGRIFICGISSANHKVDIRCESTE